MPNEVCFVAQSPNQAGVGQARPAARLLGSTSSLEKLGELKQLCVLLCTGSASGRRAGTSGMGEKGFYGSLPNMAPVPYTSSHRKLSV